MTKNDVFCRLVQQVKRSIWNQHILVNVHVTNSDKNNHPEEKELDTNHSLTLGQLQTLSTDERSFWPFYFTSFFTTAGFLILHTWIHHTIRGGIQILDQNSISDEKSQLHEIDV